MIRPTILVFLISHALLPYVDSTSIPVNDEPFAGFSNVAPAKKSLRADKTMANEERVVSEWIKPLIVTYRNKRLDEALDTILLPKPKASKSTYSIGDALQLEGTSNVLKKFEKYMYEEKLLNAFTKHYGGFSFAISTLLTFEDSKGPLGANAKKLLEMQLNIWVKNKVTNEAALDQLELIQKGKKVFLDENMTFLERYIKRQGDSVDGPLFKTLEKGFGGRDPFYGKVAASLREDGLKYPEKVMTIAGRYINYLWRSNDFENMKNLMSLMKEAYGDKWQDKYKKLMSDGL